MLTSNFDAEYGNFSGGQVLVTTKSGHQRTVMAAPLSFFATPIWTPATISRPTAPAYDRNQFGGTVGGPIRKDQVFFFADYQGTRMTQGVETGLISVPSLQNRAGDFSDIASSLTGKVNGQYWANLLSRKLGYAVTPASRITRPGCVTSAQCVLPERARFPQRAWSAPAKALLPFIPKPNQGDSIILHVRLDQNSARR